MRQGMRTMMTESHVLHIHVPVDFFYSIVHHLSLIMQLRFWPEQTSEHVTPVQKAFHWLPVSCRIHINILEYML